jgi:hypothetical protein
MQARAGSGKDMCGDLTLDSEPMNRRSIAEIRIARSIKRLIGGRLTSLVTEE